jgi:hypothetical protein
MRIIPNGIEPHNHNITGVGEYLHFDVADTIEITDEELSAIGTGWVKAGGHKKWLASSDGGKFHYEEVKPLSQYLRELIELARTK